MAENSEPVDLLGDPLRPLPDKRGRRKLKWHAEVYEKVEVLAAAGLTREEIADAIGVSVPTLRNNFRHELDKAVSRQKAEAVTLLAQAARTGNVSAIKAWNAELDKQRANDALRQRAHPVGQRAAAKARKGKKEERLEAAEGVAAAGARYAPGAAPRLIN